MAAGQTYWWHMHSTFALRGAACPRKRRSTMCWRCMPARTMKLCVKHMNSIKRGSFSKAAAAAAASIFHQEQDQELMTGQPPRRENPPAGSQPPLPHHDKQHLVLLTLFATMYFKVRTRAALVYRCWSGKNALCIS